MRAVLDFGKRDRSQDAVDLAPDLIAIHRHWKRPDTLDFLIDYIKEDPTDVPDEAIEAVVIKVDRNEEKISLSKKQACTAS